MSTERVTGPYGIRAGAEYLLHGEILKGVGMYTRFSSLRKEWNNVIPQEREKFQYYEAGCRQCQLKLCGETDLECQKKLPGCEMKANQLAPWQFLKSFCWHRYEHCEVDATGEQCYWRKTDEPKECEESNPSSINSFQGVEVWNMSRWEKNLYLQMRLKNKIKIRYYSVLINCQFNVNLDIPFLGMMLSCIK